MIRAKLKKIVLGFAVAMSLIVGNVTTVDATSLQLTVQSFNVTIGNSFKVTIKATDVAGRVSVSTSNGSVSSSSLWIDNNTSTVTVTPSATGKCTVTVKSVDTTDYNTEEPVTLTKSVSVNVLAKTTTPTPTPTPTTPTAPVKSSVSTLSSLSVVGHDLNVEFNSSTKEYNVSVAADVEKITINAAPTDSKASVSGTGEKTISEGDNNFEVVCMAENGSKSTYKINVHRKLEPLVFLTYGTATLGVVRDFKNVSIPDDYSEEPVTVSDQEITGFYAKNIARNLVYLEDEQGQESWYVVADNEIVTEISAATLLGLNGYIITVPAELIDIEGCTPAIIEIDDREVPGWTFDEEQFSDYRLIYYMDEAGNEDIYQYELSQNTLQIWEGSTISNEQYSAMISQVDNLESSLQTYTYATYGLGGALGLGALLMLIKSRKSRSLKKQSI